MEYCGAGSVSDIMRLRKKVLTEEEIATVLFDTLKGLEYLHLRKKIHRYLLLILATKFNKYYKYTCLRFLHLPGI